MLALVCRMAQGLGYQVGWRVDLEEPRWPVVLVMLPTGQVTWHVSTDDFVNHLAWLPEIETRWDGHNTEEKWRRCENFVP